MDRSQNVLKQEEAERWLCEFCLKGDAVSLWKMQDTTYSIASVINGEKEVTKIVSYAEAYIEYDEMIHKIRNRWKDVMKEEKCMVGKTPVRFMQFLDSYIVHICGTDLLFHSEAKARNVYQGIKNSCALINFE